MLGAPRHFRGGLHPTKVQIIDRPPDKHNILIFFLSISSNSHCVDVRFSQFSGIVLKMAFPVCFSLRKHYWPTVALFPFLTCPATLPILISQLSLTVFTAHLHVFFPHFLLSDFVFYKKKIRESSQEYQ